MSCHVFFSFLLSCLLFSSLFYSHIFSLPFPSSSSSVSLYIEEVEGRGVTVGAVQVGVQGVWEGALLQGQLLRCSVGGAV
jgi:hypothetical protein